MDAMDFLLKKNNPTMRVWTFRANPVVPPLESPGSSSKWRVFSVRLRPGPLKVTCFLGPMATCAPGSDVFSRSDCDPGPSK